MAGSTVQGLAAEVRGRLEIVLAEVLNNIVEHAYRDGSGPISLQIARKGQVLCFRVEDQGHPMPDGNLPRGELPTAEGPDGPSEGGFGWFLIRSLTEGLSYCRCEGVNRLCFTICVN
jgi:serine/threonine-protein kinase RsbW